MDVNRRNFVRGAAAGAAGTALTGGLLIGGARADAQAGKNAAVESQESSYAFFGEHQAGILRPDPAHKQPFASFTSFDVTARNRDELTGLLKSLTDRAKLLTEGGPIFDSGIGRPPLDSAVLGADIPADGLTVTVSLGSTVFDGRFGLKDRAPLRLTPMKVFPNDFPEPLWTGGDLLLQLCANNPDTVHHAIRDITRHTRAGMQIRWKIQGYSSPPRQDGAGRNLLGFKDGTANPADDEAPRLIWVDEPGEPEWTRNGTYQVVRVIRTLVEFWDRVSINEQEGMFGRRRESGAPMDGNLETDIPNFGADPDGKITPLDSHIRKANPRTPETDNERIVRRSYNYDLGADPNGNMQAGHIFVAYQQDIQRQFEAIQTRLIDEPLVDYVQPFGGGYFFALPGVTDANDWYGKGLLEADA
jgi:deferrochelatase/peroxidase EfeB